MDEADVSQRVIIHVIGWFGNVLSPMFAIHSGPALALPLMDKTNGVQVSFNVAYTYTRYTHWRL